MYLHVTPEKRSVNIPSSCDKTTEALRPKPETVRRSTARTRGATATSLGSGRQLMIQRTHGYALHEPDVDIEKT